MAMNLRQKKKMSLPAEEGSFRVQGLLVIIASHFHTQSLFSGSFLLELKFRSNMATVSFEFKVQITAQKPYYLFITNFV
jgi:hypothetical protein